MPLFQTPDGLPPGFQTGGRHPGDWQLHHLMLPPGPTDFTPIRPPDHAEHETTPHGDLLRYLAELFSPDHAQAVAERGREAGD